MKRNPGRGVSQQWKGTVTPSIDDVIASRDAKVIKRRILMIENDLKMWRRLFNWPALFESFERDVERLRAALPEDPAA